MIKLSNYTTENQIQKIVLSQSKKGIWDGKDPNEYFFNCRFWIEKYNDLILFTRDEDTIPVGGGKILIMKDVITYLFHLWISFKTENRTKRNKPKN